MNTKLICVMMSCVLVLAGSAWLHAATLDATTVIGSGTKAAIPLQGGAQSVSYDNDAPAGYYWADRLGDESAVAVTPGGLDMGAYSLTTTFNTSSGEIIMLDLNDESISATSGSISSAGARTH